MQYLTTISELEALFEPVGEASLRKEVAAVHPIYRAWIEASPFVVLATAGPAGLDVSPRGDPAPVVMVKDESTLLLPERRGNNRIDSLRNIVSNPGVSMIFFVPGVRETVRVNGTARICIEPDVLALFSKQGALPKCVVEVSVQAVYFQCARALLRSSLWSKEQIANRPTVPTAGEILAAVTDGSVGGKRYDDELPQRQAKTLY
ncbi:MAG: pyridoxamine 5'-phosphate oxidase family protein [Betaproteobacteria bacterium]|nr:MAG: pyridoxamine 5'-phosphate oxidase family protein [Betaproteobacteria bacterium]